MSEHIYVTTDVDLSELAEAEDGQFYAEDADLNDYEVGDLIQQYRVELDAEWEVTQTVRVAGSQYFVPRDHGHPDRLFLFDTDSISDAYGSENFAAFIAEKQAEGYDFPGEAEVVLEFQLVPIKAHRLVTVKAIEQR